MPSESGAALIHNDYKYDNLILDPNDLSRIIGVLDWEMATLGDPLMDLGVTLSYWVEATDSEAARESSFGPTMLPGSYTRRELVERYQNQTGREVPNLSLVQGLRPRWHSTCLEAIGDARRDVGNRVSVEQVAGDQGSAERRAFEVLTVAHAAVLVIDRDDGISHYGSDHLVEDEANAGQNECGDDQRDAGS